LAASFTACGSTRPLDRWGHGLPDKGDGQM
jgi:hypothetical protein